MPTINKRLLLRLMLATLVFGVGLFIVYYVQSDRTTDALRWQAERAAEAGRQDKAISYMKQYLELRPKDHEAAIKLGDMILARGTSRKDLSSVLFLYERILREAPQRDDLQRQLIDICLKLNRHGDAAIHARTCLDRTPGDGELWEKLALAQSAQNKNEEARASYEKAIECDSTRVGSYELLAELLIRQLNLPAEGRDWIEKMVRANPSVGDVYLIRARLERSQNRLPECFRNLEQLLAIDPENAEGLLMIAGLMQSKGELVKARSALADGLAMYPKDLRFYRELSFLELSSGNLPAAVVCLEQGVKLLPNATELLTPLGDLLVQQGEVERVAAILKKLEARTAAPSQIKYLRGRLFMQQAKWSEAIAVLDELRAESVAMPGLQAQVNLLLATCFERTGGRAAQEESLRRVLAIDAGHLGARLKFAEIHLTVGNLDEAIKEYTVAARSSFAPLSARVALGRLLVARARVSNNAAEWNNVADYVTQLRDKYKNTVDPILVAAEMLMARQQYDAAQKLLREEAGKRMNDARIWSVLAAVTLEAEGLHAAHEVLDDAQSLIGNQVEIRLARARIWATDWKPGREQRVRNLGRDVSDLPEADQYRVLAGLADICSTIRDFEGVKQFQTQMAARAPRELGIRKALYEVAARTGDEVLREQVRTELAALSDETVVAVADAVAEMDAKKPLGPAKLAEFRELARKIIEQTPGRADAHLLNAKLAQAAGARGEAAKEFARAIELDAGNLAYLEAQMAFLLRDGDPAIAKKRLEQLYNDPRLPGEGFLGLIEGVCSQLPVEQFDRCMTWVEPLIKKSCVSLAWLARIQQTHGRTEQAIALLLRTASASPRFIDASIALDRILPESAQDTVKRARGSLNSRAWFIICAETADVKRKQNSDWMPEFKKPEDRRSFAQACLDAFERRGQLGEATAILNKLVDDPNARKEDVVWAKRNLSMLTASRGDNGERRKAASALAEMPGEDGGIDDWRSRVASLNVAARHLHGPARQGTLAQAIQTMKRIVADKQSTAKDCYDLAQFQHLAGEHAAHRESLAEAMRRDESNLFYVTAYVDDLVNEGKLKEAEGYLPRLLDATHDPYSTSTAARYYALANLPARALEIVDQYIQAADAGTPEALSRSRYAAQMLDKIARQAAAKKLPDSHAIVDAALDKYRLSLKNYPESAGAMALLLAFDGRVAEAFDLLASLKLTISMKGLSATAVDLLRTGGATPKHFQQTKEWLDAALARDPHSSTLKLNLAEYHAMRHEYALAEPVYAEVLKSEPDNVVALNNLAWMLAPRPNASEQALKCVEHAIELMGATGELLDTRARIEIARGETDKAIGDLKQSLDEGPSSLRYFHLALAQSKQLNKNAAAQSFKEAQTRGLEPSMIHPNDLPAYKVMAAQERE